ncbi:type I-E CRISPR-associated protein Cse2/CasB [Nocardia sp. R16R-3T]
MTQRYWKRHLDKDGDWKVKDASPPGAELAALRAGLGRPALTVPKMWPFYTVEPDPELERFGAASPGQEAEHAALAFYGLHQQSQQTPMHRHGVGLGSALLVLRRHDRRSADAVDRRVSALVTSTSVPALLGRLRGLVTQLRDIHQPLDYDRLMGDLEAWPWPEGRQRVRKTWAQGYQRWDDEKQRSTDLTDNTSNKEES